MPPVPLVAPLSVPTLPAPPELELVMPPWVPVVVDPPVVWVAPPPVVAAVDDTCPPLVGPAAVVVALELLLPIGCPPGEASSEQAEPATTPTMQTSRLAPGECCLFIELSSRDRTTMTIHSAGRHTRTGEIFRPRVPDVSARAARRDAPMQPWGIIMRRRELCADDPRSERTWVRGPQSVHHRTDTAMTDSADGKPL